MVLVMKDYRAIRELEEQLMEEISHEKFFSLKRWVKVFELQGLFNIR